MKRKPRLAVLLSLLPIAWSLSPARPAAEEEKPLTMAEIDERVAKGEAHARSC